jgi:hypothetical protein
MATAMAMLRVTAMGNSDGNGDGAATATEVVGGVGLIDFIVILRSKKFFYNNIQTVFFTIFIK